jgi:hypothetical protein
LQADITLAMGKSSCIVPLEMSEARRVDGEKAQTPQTATKKASQDIETRHSKRFGEKTRALPSERFPRLFLDPL